VAKVTAIYQKCNPRYLNFNYSQTRCGKTVCPAILLYTIFACGYSFTVKQPQPYIGSIGITIIFNRANEVFSPTRTHAVLFA
jgi:hypothetical protein